MTTDPNQRTSVPATVRIPSQRAGEPDRTDPMGDVAALLTELRRRVPDDDAPVFVGYFVRFGTDARAVGSAQWQALADGWQTAVYADPDGYRLRLSREAPVSEALLRADRAYLLRLAHVYQGRWDALVLEDLTPAEPWGEIAERVTAWTRDRCAQPAADGAQAAHGGARQANLSSA